jgi:hypothetical protein
VSPAFSAGAATCAATESDVPSSADASSARHDIDSRGDMRDLLSAVCLGATADAVPSGCYGPARLSDANSAAGRIVPPAARKDKR